MGIHLAESVGRLFEYVLPEEIGDADDEVSGCDPLFILIGFPNFRNPQGDLNPATGLARKAWGNTAFVAELSQRLPDQFVARDGKSLAAHFALQAKKKMRPSGGGPECNPPDFHGMSGGGVWKLHIDPRTRLVERCALVGIFIERENQSGIIALRAVRVGWASDYMNWWPADRPLQTG